MTVLVRVGLAVALSMWLGGCLDAVTHPLNFEPSAYEDSLCPRAPQTGGEIVNYGCAAGQDLAPAARVVRVRY